MEAGEAGGAVCARVAAEWLGGMGFTEAGGVSGAKVCTLPREAGRGSGAWDMGTAIGDGDEGAGDGGGREAEDGNGLGRVWAPGVTGDPGAGGLARRPPALWRRVSAAAATPEPTGKEAYTFSAGEAGGADPWGLPPASGLASGWAAAGWSASGGAVGRVGVGGTFADWGSGAGAGAGVRAGRGRGAAAAAMGLVRAPGGVGRGQSSGVSSSSNSLALTAVAKAFSLKVSYCCSRFLVSVACDGAGGTGGMGMCSPPPRTPTAPHGLWVPGASTDS